jgi:peptidoglycan/LPS O-acetylase OafA/YrhL
MIMTGPVSRLVLGSAGLNGTAVWTTTPAVLDALGLGCLLAYLWQYTESADRWARWAFFCGSVLIGCQAMASKLGLASHPVFTLAVSTLGWRLLCVWLVHRAARGAPGWLGRWLVTRPLIFVGTISYGIYLIHPFVMPTVLLIERRFNVHFPIPNYPGFGQFLSVALISIAIASLSWRFFERPINSLKNRFPYVSNTRAIAEPSRPSTDNAHASPYSKTNSVNWL